MTSDPNPPAMAVSPRPQAPPPASASAPLVPAPAEGELPETVVAEGVTYRVLRSMKKDFFSENLLLDRDGKTYVLKISRFRHIFGSLFEPLSGWISRREYAMYRRVDGIRGIPSLHGMVGRNGYIHEFIPGRNLRQHQYEIGKHTLPDTFFDELMEILKQVHARGVAHNDMAKKGNFIVGDDGHPYLLDFHVSIGILSEPLFLRRFTQALYKRLCQADIYHLLKFKEKYRPDLVTPAEHAIIDTRSPSARLYRIFIMRPYQFLKRLVYPKGSNETFRFGRKPEQRRD